LVVSILVACGGNSIPVATEPQASGPGPQREEVTILATAVPVAETKASANKTATSDDSSAESQTPSPALTVAASGGTTQMEQNPVLEAAIPSVAGSAVIGASFPVTQTVGTLGDLTDILEFEIQVVDITSTSATVTAQTSIDVACAVAFGTTTEYGRLAVDSDMGGTGHGDHLPLLTGLEPDTEYHLTFGGIGPDGTVNGYKDLTFRTKAADAEPASRPQNKNLALAENGGRVTRVSSNYGSPSMDSSFDANNALDGNPSTQWSSQGDGNGAWIEIEFAQDSHVTSLGFWTRTMGTSAQISSFRVVTNRGETFGPFDLSDASAVHYFDVDLTVKRLRLETVDSSGGNTGAVEIEVYGEPTQ